MTKLSVRFFLLIIPAVILLQLPGTLIAQNNNQEITSEDTDDVVRIVRFSGNETIRNSQLKALVRTETNREFLGIPRFTPWYYLWRVIRIGESPSYLNRDVVANDMERIQVYYESMGFFDANVDTTIIEYRPKRVEVSFIIDEGPRSRISTVSYTGLPEFENPDLLDEFFDDSHFNARMLNDSTFTVNRNYNAQELRREQTRIINFLKDNGFASVQRDSVRALVKPTVNENEFDVLYTIRPGRFYTFGDVTIVLSGPDGPNEYDREQILEGDPYTVEGNFINMKKQDAAQTRFITLTEQLKFKPGDPFDQSAYLRTVRTYQNLGIFLTNRFGLSEEGSLPDYTKEQIPVFFDLQTVPKHSISAEIFGMRRYGFGSGFGVNYNNNNLRGRADNLTIGVNTSLEYVTSGTLPETFDVEGSTIFQSYEVRTEYTVPRLNFPFRRFDDSDWVQNSRTRYSLTYSQSNQLFFDINSDIRFNLRYELEHSDRLTSLFDLVEMDIIDAELSGPFRQSLENEFGLNSVEFLRIEEDFRPQFSSILRYTIRSRNTDIIKRNFGHIAEFSAAFGGNVPYLMDRYLFSPGEIKQTLPSPFGISSNALGYSRFIKFTGDYRRYIELTPNTVFAVRGFAGVAHPIFESESIPLSRRFFAGGSNDIRGWNAFQLGPGSISSEDVTVQGGEIKLAAYKEFRQMFIQRFLNGEWQLAWHTDAGNIWYGPKTSLLDDEGNELLDDGRFYMDRFYEQIAVGSGFGVRIDWDFLVARFDLTYRVHDLQQGWFNDSTRYFSFGIGHSF